MDVNFETSFTPVQGCDNIGNLQITHCPTLMAALKNQYQKSGKIAILGGLNSGKSAFIQKLAGKSLSQYAPTQGIQIHSFIVPIMKNSELSNVRLNFWDAGYYQVHRFDEMLNQLVEQADIYLYIISILDRNAFEEVQEQMDRTKKNIIVLTNLSRQLEADFFAYEVKALQTDIFLEDDQALLPHLASLI